MRSATLAGDAALMRGFAKREQGAAEELYARFASRIYGLGIVMLGGDAAAQDLVQDTFVKLWRNAERYDTTRGRLETWVLLIARSLAIDTLRRRVLESRSLEACVYERKVRREAPNLNHRLLCANGRCLGQ